MTMERVHDPVSAGAAGEEASGENDLLAMVGDPEPAPDVRETYGTVESVGGEGDGDAIVVRISGRPVRVRRAVSCLVQPGVGDRVLVALPRAPRSYAGLAEESYVLAVLARGERGASGVTLAVDGDVTLKAQGGKVALVATEGVTLTSAAKVELNAPELEVRAMKTSFFSASLAYIGRTLDGEIDRVRLAARTVDRAIDRVTERIQQSFRTIDQIERVKAKELDIDVDGDLDVHSDNTIMASEKLVKVDGEQIHFG